ncbi:MAG: amino acid adenylation domain-containing protein [Vicinamibacterales bacterium]
MSRENVPELHRLSVEELDALERLLPDGADSGAIRARGVAGDACLSSAQRRLWIVDQLRPCDPAYNLALSFRIRGPLDAGALRGSLTELVRRHEALRTTFVVVDGEPRQRVLAAATVALPIGDLRAVPATSRDEEAARLARAEIETPFDLAQGPLFRPRLLRLADDDHVLVLTMHHIVTDGWSMGIILAEIAALYRSASGGRVATLQEPRLQYADYAEWQHEQQQLEPMRRHLEYWRCELADAPELQLPHDRERGRTPSTRGGADTATIDRGILDQLDVLARRGRATRYMALVAVYVVLLSRYSRQRDIVIGTSIAGRNRAELEGIVGLFVNVLPLRVMIPARTTFRGLLSIVRDRLLAAFEREDLPFDVLVDAVAPSRTFERHPIFQVSFSAQDMTPTALDLAGLSVEPFRVQPRTTRFDLEFYVLESSATLRLHEVYSTDLFDATTAKRLLRHYETLLRAAVEHPDADLDELEILTAGERLDLERWNDTTVDLRAVATFVDLFQRHVQTQPDAAALVFGERTDSYRELDAAAEHMAHRLRTDGIARGALVGLCVERSPEMIAALLGIMKAGAAFVPLDASHPPERLADMVADARLDALVTEPSLRAVFPTFRGVVVDDVRWDDASRAPAAPSHQRLPDQPLSGSDLAYVIYTSGSTGRPKGTLLEHRGLVNVVSEQKRQFGVGPGDRVLQFASLSFDASVFEIVLALGTGATLVVGTREALVPGQPLADFIDRHQVSATVLPPSVLALVPPVPLPTLRVLTVAGEACSRELVNQWAHGRRFFNLYGPTETTIWATASGALAPGDAPVIGTPIGNTRVYVLDDRLNPVPVAVAGEMYIGGVGVARGYLHRPRLTAERFVPDPFSGTLGARLYRTGDLVRFRHGGSLEFVGRRDYQLKLHGYRIEPGEIETALTELPGVETAVVKLWEKERTRRLVAYVLAADGAARSVAALREALRTRLPPYMVPGVFVYLDELPLTSSGKLNRSMLPEPTVAEAEETAADGTPRNSTEETLARVWADVLGLQAVGTHDNFFDVGGDSILSIQIASRARAAGVALSPQDFFEHQTVAEQAAHAGLTDPQAADAIIAGEVPATPIQRWFFEQNLACPNQFVQSVLLELRERVEPSMIQAALDALAKHHDVLRSRAIRTGGGWVMEIRPPARVVELAAVDASVANVAERSAVIERACAAAQATLDVERGRVCAAVHCDCGPGSPGRLFVAIHHLVIDVVSWSILLQDLESALDQLRNGRTPVFPARTTSVGTWANRLHDLADSAWLAEQIPYWLAVRPVDSSAAIEIGCPDATNTYGAASTLTVRFTREETARLLHEVQRASHTRIHELLVGSLALSLAREDRTTSVLLDVEGHGRGPVDVDVDVSRTVGWFTATYPVRIDIPPACDVDDALAAARGALRGVPAAGIGYGLLRFLSSDTAIRGRLNAARSSVLFNYLGHVDSALAQSRLFAFAREPLPSPVAPENRRPYAVEINARILDGELLADWTFNPRLHPDVTMERLSKSFSSVVRQLIDRIGPSGEAADLSLAQIDGVRTSALLERYRAHGVEDVYPLTPLQHGMLVHSMAAAGTGAFVTQAQVVFGAELDGELFRQVWTLVQAQHPILRTIFADVDGEFRQVVLRSAELSWSEHDWSALPEAECAARLDAFLVDERAVGFDVAAQPPSRLALIKTAAPTSHLVWTHHHALLDGWSGAMLLDEVFTAYNRLRRGVVPAVERRPKFRDHVGWLARRDRSDAPTFWREMFAGFTAPTRLSVDRAAGSRVRSVTRIQEIERSLSPERTRSVAAFAARHRLTLSTVVHGAWALLLSRYSGDRRVVFGTAVAGRPAVAGVERAVGLFMNGLPVPALVEPDWTTSAWLAQLQKTLVRLREHEYDALWEIQEWGGLAGGQPLFETTLAFESYPVAPSYGAAAREIGLADFRLVSHTSAALHLRVVPGERLRLMLNHDTERFDAATAAVMLEQVENVLAQFADAPDTRVDRVWLGGGTADRLPDVSAPLDVAWHGPVHTQIREQAARDPRRVAIVHDGVSTTYGELQEHADRLAGALRGAGVDEEHVVAVLAPRGVPLVAGLLGTLEAGAAFTILDPAYPASQLMQRLEIARAKVVLHACARDAEPPVLRQWAQRTGGRAISLLDRHDAAPASWSRPEPSPDSPAYVAFTSGSTGEPKAVLGRHASLARYAHWLRNAFGIGSRDRFSMLSALPHDPLLRDVFPPLQLGATLCIPRDQVSGAPGELAAWAAAERVTCMNLTPSLAQILVEGAPRTALPVLQHAFFVGEPLTTTLVRRMRQVAPAAACVNLYGATETQQALGSWITEDGSLDRYGAVVPSGNGMPAAQVVVARDRQPAAIGEIGEVWIRSPLLAAGYLHDATLTAARFVADAFGPGSGPAYRTGDIGRYLPAGEVLVLGRRDDQVKIRGFRVEPSEIESVILRHPEAGAVAVVSVADARGERSLVAYVTGGAELGELGAIAKAHLPAHMVPERFIRMPGLPYTETGKVDRRALASRELPERQSPGGEAPHTPTEISLAEIWKALLPLAAVSRSDSFFDLGGHSIMAARLAARIRERFAVDVRIADVFDRPRLADLAAFVDQSTHADESLVSELLEEIQGLSADELQAILDDAGASEGPSA